MARLFAAAYSTIHPSGVGYRPPAAPSSKNTITGTHASIPSNTCWDFPRLWRPDRWKKVCSLLTPLTYGEAFVSLVNPYAGLLIYICFSIIKPEAMWHWSVPAGNYSRIVAIALLIGWAMAGFGNWKIGRARGIVAAFLAFFGCAVASTMFAAANSAVGWLFVEAQLKIVLPFVVGITLVNSTQRLQQLVWVIVLSQGYVAFEMNLSYFDGFNRVQELGFGGMDNNSIAIAMVTTIGVAFFLALSEALLWRSCSRWRAPCSCSTPFCLLSHAVARSRWS